jgi:UDP-2-acetamido-3-amino-2,3-dideoxy-glucuronate N-acetyltransferase
MNRSFKLRSFSQDDGIIVPIEFEKELPFVPRRMFYIFDVPERQVRGDHAHKTCHQIFIPISGFFAVHATPKESYPNGQSFFMDDPRQAVHVEPMTWVSVTNFSPGAVCLVLTSHPYDPNDYINSKDEFHELVKKQNG